MYGIFESCRIASSIVAGHGFSSPYGVMTGPTAWLPPVYPYIVAIVFKLLGVYSVSSLWALVALNVIFETATVALLFRIGMRCFGPMVAFGASLLWAINVGAASYCVRLWESSLSALLAAIAILLYLDLLSSPGKLRDWLFYALTWAVAALTNTALLALMPFPVLALLLFKGRQTWRPALCGLAVFVVLLVPWTARNYVAFHKLMPVRSNFGPNLWYGNHPGVQGPDDQTLNPARNPSELAIYQSLGEAQYAASRQGMALSFIRENPQQFIQLTVRRFIYFWGASETSSPAFEGCISVIALIGLLLLCQKSWLLAPPFASALLLFPLPYYFTHAEIFYRHPIDPTFSILIVYAFAALLETGLKPSSARPSGKPTERVRLGLAFREDFSTLRKNVE